MAETAGFRWNRGPGPTALTLLLLALPAIVLSGCDREIREQAKGEISNGERLNQRQRELLRAQMDGRVHKERRPYYGAAVQVETGSISGTPLPKQVEGARGIGILIPEQADVRAIVTAITEATGIPVNIRTRYVSDDGIIDVPIGTRMAVEHEGPLSVLLDKMAARMDVAWRYDGKVISVDRMVRRSWRVSLPLGETTFKTGEDAESALLGPAVSRTFTLDPWKELEERLAPLAPPPGSVTVSREAGRVEVFGPPSVQRAVATVIEETMKTANARIGLEIGVFFIDTAKSDSFGVNLDMDGHFNTVTGAIRTRLTEGANWPFRTADSQGAIISNDGNVVSFEALAEDAAVVDYQLASSVVQSGTVAPLNLTERMNFIFKTSTQREEGQGDNVTTDYDVRELVTGLNVTVMPRMIENRRIHLLLIFDERRLLQLEKIVDAGAIVIQSPKTENRRFENQAVLRPGETLVLSGYERETGERTERGVGLLRRFGVGGENTAKASRVRMILMVRPTLIDAHG